MWNFLRSGGLPMAFILLFGVLTLGAAFFFAVRADRRPLGFIRSMAMATLFSTIGTSCADVGATLASATKVYELADPPGYEPRPGEPRWLPAPPDAAASMRAMRVVVEGLAESTSPGILGFSFLAMVWMLLAVGRRRVDERDDQRGRAA